MPLITLLQGASFNPNEVQLLSAAFEDALRTAIDVVLFSSMLLMVTGIVVGAAHFLF